MSTKRKPEFFNEFYPIEIKQERCKIIENLTREILRGVENQYGPPYAHPLQSRFETSVAACMLPFFQTNHKMSSAWTLDHGDTYSLIAQAFREAMRYNHGEILTPFLGDEEMERKFQEEFGNPTFNWSEEATPDLVGAWGMARKNYLGVETRLVSMRVLHALLRASKHRYISLDGFTEIHETLLHRRTHFLRNYLMFGMMIGGSVAKATARECIRKLLCDPDDPDASCDYSTIQYLHADGQVPNIYNPETEDSFHNAIVKAYEELA
jgi:hypothetical protein